METRQGLTYRHWSTWLASACNVLALLVVVWVAFVPGAASVAMMPAGDEDAMAEAALDAMERGEFQQAAAQLREGLRTLPSSVLLHNLAGAVLLLTGDRAGSVQAWQYVRRAAPTDSLSAYGLAMASLLAGDVATCERLLEEASVSGDAGVCLLGRSYVAFLRDPHAVSSPPLPEAVRLGRDGLRAAVAEARGDTRVALELVQSTLADPTVGRYAEYPSLLMTFDRQKPLSVGAPRLPAGVLNVPRPRGVSPVGGVVSLTVRDWDAAYVALRVDGRLMSVANTRPFRFNWDTATSPDGPHRVEMVGFDSRGDEIYRQQREVVTHNPGAPLSERRRQVLARLWALMALRPSRAALALMAARVAARSSDAATAQRWVWRACAIDPDVVPDAWLPRLTSTGEAEPLWHVTTNEKLVALTFDDGPRPGITERLLEILQREGVPATFFAIGRHAAASPDLVARLAEAGMELANHSFSHPNLARLSEPEVRRELLRTSGCIGDVTGRPPAWFRPPGGNASSRLIRVARSLGLRACMWTVNGEQKELQGAGALTAHVLGAVRPGAVVLLHNGREATVSALETLIRQMKLRGYRFVTVSELAARQVPLEVPPVLQ